MLTGAALARCRRDFAQHLEFGLALHVEAADAGLQRPPHLGAGLADAGEDDVRALARRRPARARARRPTRCRSRSRPARTPAARPATSWPSCVADLRLAAGEAALVGGQRRQHRRPWNRRTAACRAARARSRQRAPPRRTVRRRGSAKWGWPGRVVVLMAVRTGEAVPVARRRPRPGGAAGVAAPTGLSVCGRVARLGGGRLGRQEQRRLSGRRRPSTRPRRRKGKRARSGALTRIWQNIQHGKL